MAIPALENLGTEEHHYLDVEATALVVGSGAETLYSVEVDNRNNTAVTYLKLYDDAAPSVGTDAPEVILRVPASTRMVHHLNGGVGLVFGTALSMVCVTGGGTAGATAPTNDVRVDLITN